MAFNPIIDPINNNKNKHLNTEKGSLKKAIPMIAVPKAPMPVQTA